MLGWFAVYALRFKATAVYSRGMSVSFKLAVRVVLPTFTQALKLGLAFAGFLLALFLVSGESVRLKAAVSYKNVGMIVSLVAFLVWRVYRNVGGISLAGEILFNKILHKVAVLLVCQFMRQSRFINTGKLRVFALLGAFRLAP